jgi:hypothetical protein
MHYIALDSPVDGPQYDFLMDRMASRPSATLANKDEGSLESSSPFLARFFFGSCAREALLQRDGRRERRQERGKFA